MVPKILYNSKTAKTYQGNYLCIEISIHFFYCFKYSDSLLE